MKKANRAGDAWLREIASKYIERYGKELKGEADSLGVELKRGADSLGVEPKGGAGLLGNGDAGAPALCASGASRALDELVHKNITKLRGRQRAKWAGAIAAAAACLALAAMLPRMANFIGQSGRRDMAAMPPAGTIADGGNAPDSPAAPSGGAPGGDSTSGGALGGRATDGVSPDYGAIDGGSPDYGNGSAPQYDGAIPLGFALPAGFSISNAEQDREKTIYYLEHAASDDIVLVMEPSQTAALDELIGSGELNTIEIGPNIAYGAYNADFSELVFERGGIVYDMTCKYDINTLIGLCGAIMRAA
ncbi:MAG: hypothetical protein LBJ10_03535 [Clostridiales bacterium]|jgi:hypothetical protein|nr:hypothetical protein [Clostridiales bacterium]